MRIPLSLMTAFTAVAVIAGAPSTAGGADSAAATLTVHGSDYGQILFDGRGRALYAFTRDSRGRSACSGACAAAWPPYLARGALRPAAGVRASLLGSIRRGDGTRQVTYAGHPLYYYVRDRRPGEVRCQNVFGFGGLWLVVRASGRLVR